MKYGYARVSTDAQVRHLTRAECKDAADIEHVAGDVPAVSAR
jgi:DNA invertase Pin-like site-specific DNA recombinase